jgi:Replication-relaxation
MTLPMSDPVALFSQKRRRRNAPPVEVGDFELQILRAVHRYRLLEWRQIQNLFRTSVGDTKHLAERVELLYRNAYLEAVPRPRYADEGATGDVYRLGAEGAVLLSGQLSIPFPQFQYWGKGDDKDRRQTKTSRDYLSHSIELADIRIAIERAAVHNGYTLELWRDETELKRGGTWPHVTVETARGEQMRVPILPDGYFVLVGSQGRALFFLEHDRSTEVIGVKWQRKILGYKAFVLSGAFHTSYGISGSSTPLRILTTTPSLARTQHLKAAAERYGQSEGTALFLFTPLSELLSHDALTSPIWLRAGSTELQSIL